MNEKTLEGKVALLPGSTRGIGLETARGLARLGAKVVIVGRNQETGHRVAEEISATGGEADFIRADLSLMDEIRQLAQTFRATYSRLDLLIQSADVLSLKRTETAEGQEVSFATNYLGRFLLVNLLLDMLKASAPARIIHIAAAGIPGKFDPANFPPGPATSAFSSHNTGQMANDIFGVELASRLEGTGVSIKVLNPGIVDTEIRRRGDARWLALALETVFRPVTQSAEHYSQLVVQLATAPEPLAALRPILYNRKGKALPVRSSISDPQVRRQLWSISEQLVGLTTSGVRPLL